MDHRGRRARLSEGFADPGFDALYVSRLPNVRYLSGFSGSNGHLLVTSGGGGALLTDGRYTWQAEREVPDLERITYRSNLPGALADALRDLGAMTVGFEADTLTVHQHAGLLAAGVQLVPTLRRVESLRAVKDPEELTLLQAAQDATDSAYDVVTSKLAEGMTEQEVAFELEAAMRQAGAEGLAFDTIVGIGPGAAEPHHRPTRRPLMRGDVVKMDFGALVDGYHADMTRTVAFGEPSSRVRDVYELVRRAQLAGVDAVRPGATGAEVDAAARSIVAGAGFAAEFPHGLGHGVGLEIHEAPSLHFDGEDVLEVGHVVTVEPGIYLPGAFGVRIEDMVEVTASGQRVMASAPKDLVVV